MIIDYDHNPALNEDQKLQSLKESVQMALDGENANLWAKIKAYVASVLPKSHSDLAPLYGVCSTIGTTAAKTVTIPGVTELYTGLTISVYFIGGNMAASPTLNVNNLGAKAIMRYGTVRALSSASNSWNSGAVIKLTYDGTYWVMNDWINTQYDVKTAASGGTSVSLVTTGEKYTWNSKASTAVATTSTNGLMSAADKANLDAVVAALVDIQADITALKEVAEDAIMESFES